MAISLVSAKEVDKNLDVQLSGTADEFAALFTNASDELLGLWELIAAHPSAAGMSNASFDTLETAQYDSGDGVYQITMTIPRN